MNVYAVSIVWIKPIDGGINVVNSVSILEADSDAEAFGLAYDKVKAQFQNHSVHLKTVSLICKDYINN